jgi:hypothetical protein
MKAGGKVVVATKVVAMRHAPKKDAAKKVGAMRHAPKKDGPKKDGPKRRAPPRVAARKGKEGDRRATIGAIVVRPVATATVVRRAAMIGSPAATTNRVTDMNRAARTNRQGRRTLAT